METIKITPFGKDTSSAIKVWAEMIKGTSLENQIPKSVNFEKKSDYVICKVIYEV